MSDREWSIDPSLWPDWTQAMDRYEALLRDLPPVPRWLECGPAAAILVMSLATEVSNPSGGGWATPGPGLGWAMGVDLRVSEKRPPWSWRFLDKDGNVLKEGSFRP